MLLLVTITLAKFRSFFVPYVSNYVSLCGLLPPVTTNGSCPFGLPGSFVTSLHASLLHSGPLASIEQQVPSRQTLDGLQFSRSHEVSTMNGDKHRQYHTAVGPQTPCSLNSFALIGLGIAKTLVMRNPTTGMKNVRMATMVIRMRLGSGSTAMFVFSRIDWFCMWVVWYTNRPGKTSRRVRGRNFVSRCQSLWQLSIYSSEQQSVAGSSWRSFRFGATDRSILISIIAGFPSS